MGTPRPHTLGVDDGPFEKAAGGRVPIVAVMMEGRDLVEVVARTEFPVDGDGVTEFLVDWLGGLRCAPSVRAVFLGGITIAGLAVVDVAALSAALEVPVLVVNRRDPTDHRLASALEAAGLGERLRVVERAPAPHPVDGRVHVSAAGIEPGVARDLVRAARLKSDLPEPLRLAHLIAAAIASGESRGRP